MHHWNTFGEQAGEAKVPPISALERQEMRKLEDQVSRLERREAALTGALTDWRDSGSVPAAGELRALGLAAGVVDAYETATASAAAAGAARAGVATEVAAAAAAAAAAGAAAAGAPAPATIPAIEVRHHGGPCSKLQPIAPVFKGGEVSLGARRAASPPSRK